MSIDHECPRCQASEMLLSAAVAAHDDGLLDILLACEECSLVLNGFLRFDHMCEVPA